MSFARWAIEPSAGGGVVGRRRPSSCAASSSIDSTQTTTGVSLPAAVLLDGRPVEVPAARPVVAAVAVLGVGRQRDDGGEQVVVEAPGDGRRQHLAAGGVVHPALAVGQLAAVRDV